MDFLFTVFKNINVNHIKESYKKNNKVNNERECRLHVPVTTVPLLALSRLIKLARDINYVIF